jgi:hypothetical protein
LFCFNDSSEGNGQINCIDPDASKFDSHYKKNYQMTFQFPKWLAYIKFAVAMLMLFSLYVGTNPKFWGWLLFFPLFLTLVFESARTYLYSLTINGDNISVAGFKRAQYRISEIDAINVWVAKGGRIAVITFSDLTRLSFSSRLQGFDKLIESLRMQAKLPEQNQQS